MAVVGFGRFGSLLARLLKEVVGADVELAATSRSDHRQAARELGIVWQTLRQAAGADVVILTVPVRELIGVIEQVRPYVRPGALVMDTCSVKMYPARVLSENLPQEVAVLGTHPLFGPDGVRQFGIAGQRVALCPVRVDEPRLALVEQWYAKLGVKVLRCSPEEHDRQAAISQGLVHFIGRAIERAGFSEPTLSTSNAHRLFQLAESVANDSWQLFHDIETLNPFAKGIREDFLNALRQIENELPS